MAGARILGIIISKFGHWQEPSLIVLLEVDKCLEVGFHYMILLFCLTVCLQVKDGGESPLDIKEVAK